MKEINYVFSSELYKIIKRKKYIKAFLIASLPSIAMIICTVLYKVFDVMMPTTGISSLCFVDVVFFTLVIGAFISSSIGEDYTNEGMKQIVSSGIPRRKVVIGQWLAMTVVVSTLTIILGVVFCIISTVIYEFGQDVTVSKVVMLPIAEIIYVGVLVAFVQTMMHITGAPGATIALTALVYIASSMVISMVAIYIKWDWIDKVWFSNVLSAALSSDDGIGKQFQNMGGALIYQAVFLILAVKVFERKQL